MKLSEVIKAIENGSKNEFESDELEIVKSGENILICFKKQNMVYINPTRIFEEVKPPRQWSEKELMLFKLLPDWANWIAQEKESDLCIYESKPIQNQYGGFNHNGKDAHSYETIDKDIFSFLTITFEESPIYIGDLKGE